MCAICKGETMDDVLLRMHLRIAGGDWSFTAVRNEPPEADWTYTTGLCTNFDHPELVITAVQGLAAAAVLEQLCEAVRKGHRFSTDVEIDINCPNGRNEAAGFIEVHQAQLEPTLANWVRYYGSLGGPMPELRALQLVMPDSWFCEDHARAQPLLDRPWPILGEAGNRANRRGGVWGRSRPRLW